MTKQQGAYESLLATWDSRPGIDEPEEV